MSTHCMLRVSPLRRRTEEDDEALAMAKVLEELKYEWFEAPLLDKDLDGYARLAANTTVPIVPSGNWCSPGTQNQPGYFA